MTRNQQGFTLVENLLIGLLVLFVGFTVWYVADAHKQKQYAAQIESRKHQSASKNEKKAEEAPVWQRVESGQKAFSMQLPDGWGEVLRPVNEDLLTIRGERQPTYEKGKDIVVKDIEGFGTDAPGVFMAFMHNNVAEPRGTATDFTAGELVGKKYVYIAESDSERGLGQEDKGDKYYDYRFTLQDGRQLIVRYNVYVAVDAKDQVEAVDKIVESVLVK